MKKLFKNSLSILFLSILLLAPYKVQAIENTILENNAYTNAIYDLKMDMRRLWIDHMWWTRNFIISDLASLDDKEDIFQRLLENQDNIGNSIKPYYGEEAGNKLSSLLKEHILLAGKVVDATKDDSKDDLEKYNKLWHENADKIADFLSSANPNYSNKDLKDMLYKHLQLITDQAAAMIKKDWKSGIETFDRGEDHIIKLADMLSDGIIKQFPKKFK